ncbi:putative phosphatidate phosphatase [Trichogramma pretiosum]|uniref:putative phosphatidate phosphatase n=1 Tax=Trichogramma pretiosum TaxID=7493 RepID=UPI0006C99ADD|nr:putative phosphatidate phosphatase [Trichogramma pretiosum]
MDRGSRFIVRKIVIDFLCLLCVGMIVLTFYLFGTPYKRGFFCNDESLAHPMVDSTVTSPMLYVIGLFLPICTMLAFEYHHAKGLPEKKPLVVLGKSIPYWMTMAYEKIGVFGFGAAVTVMTTDIAKYTIGRLRPHFLTICNPKINCSWPENQHRYITDYVCEADGVSPKVLKELRLSFPSGHSSFAAYTMIFLALYLQLRLTWPGSKLFRHFLQYICIMMAWYTAMTRVSNYKHHWSDVLAGLGIGTVIALIMVFCIGDLFKERRLQSAYNRSQLMIQRSSDMDKLRDYNEATSAMQVNPSVLSGSAPPSSQSPIMPNNNSGDNVDTHQFVESTPLRSESPTYGGTDGLVGNKSRRYR